MSAEVNAYAAVSLHTLGQVVTCSTRQHHSLGGQADSRWMIWSVMTGRCLDAIPRPLHTRPHLAASRSEGSRHAEQDAYRHK